MKFKVDLELKSATKKIPESRSLLFEVDENYYTTVRVLQEIREVEDYMDRHTIEYYGGVITEPYRNSPGLGLYGYESILFPHQMDELCELLQIIKKFLEKSEPHWEKKLERYIKEKLNE